MWALWEAGIPHICRSISTEGQEPNLLMLILPPMGLWKRQKLKLVPA
jgi:hypothetical protein